jgi:hypothetical protein
VSKYSEIGTSRVGEVVGVETLSKGRVPIIGCGWETSGEGWLILVATRFIILSMSAKVNLISAS